MTMQVKNAEELIAAKIGEASTLPSEYYVDPAVLTQEQASVFGKTWQIAGRRDQLQKPGDYLTTELAGEPLLIVRGQEGELRGFYNVCRHRAGPPATGCGNRKLFRCGYHGWTYDLAGKLIKAPEYEGQEGFCAEEFGLRPVKVAEWRLWVFVNLDPKAEELLPALREVPQQAAKFPVQEMKLYERRLYPMACNWKVYVDNYLEGYHLPSVHPGLNKELDYSEYVSTQFERHSLQSSPIRGPENEKSTSRRYKQVTGDMSVDYFWIFPNWMLNCYPDNMSLNIVLPQGPERCLAIFEWYFTEDVLKTETPQNSVRFSDEIQVEDGHICEVVHRNLKSRSYSRGRYSVKQERCLHHFHRLYAEAMAL